MRSVYLMAVDLGTTYIKAAVYDTEGKQISVTRQAVNSDSSRPGVFIQHGDEIYNSVVVAMKRAAQLAWPFRADIAAIGFTGQMESRQIYADQQLRDRAAWRRGHRHRWAYIADTRGLRRGASAASGKWSPRFWRSSTRRRI